MVKHLSTDELLLLADGEASAEQSAHFDGCVECQEQLGALLGELTTISSVLTASIDGAEESARSWGRLEAAMARASASGDLHLTPEELLLLIDGELSPARVEHAQRCAGCASAQSHLQKLLWDVECELRTLTPGESVERRLAAEQALKQYLYADEPKVAEFPARRVVRYAAAAAALLTFAVGGWLWNQPTVAPAPAVVAESAPQAVAAAAIEPAQEILSRPLVVEAAAAPVTPERFVLAASSTPAAPRANALPVLTPALTPPTAETYADLGVASALPAVRRPEEVAVAQTPQPAGVEPVPEAAYEALLEARHWQLNAGLWREDVRPVWREGGIAFVGSVESANARDRYVEAMRRQAEGQSLAFDLTVRPGSRDDGGEPYAGGDAAAGGLVRTALVEHYRDAARRSFRSTDLAGLEGEIARYVSDIFRSQSDLVAHAYELDQLLNHAPLTDGADAKAKKLQGELVRFHVAGAAQGEATIYDHLSEALPRRYWHYQGEDGEAAASDDLRAESGALLQDVLSLERTLTTVFTGSGSTLAADRADSSSGELLRRIHDRLGRIRDLTRSAF